VHFAGCTPNPDEAWMTVIARNLTDCEDGFLNNTRYLIMDRDTKFGLPRRFKVQRYRYLTVVSVFLT
jgi:hypothetical protein